MRDEFAVDLLILAAVVSKPVSISVHFKKLREEKVFLGQCFEVRYKESNV